VDAHLTGARQQSLCGLALADTDVKNSDARQRHHLGPQVEQFVLWDRASQVKVVVLSVPTIPEILRGLWIGWPRAHPRTVTYLQRDREGATAAEAAALALSSEPGLAPTSVPPVTLVYRTSAMFPVAWVVMLPLKRTRVTLTTLPVAPWSSA
jgi:hypothetical protein